MKTAMVDFYYVFSAWNDPGVPAYHVTVRDTPENMDEVALIGGASRDRVLNIAQAEAEGFTLEGVGAALNTDSLRTIDALNQQLAALSADAVE
jgi:hypothetical protein